LPPGYQYQPGHGRKDVIEAAKTQMDKLVFSFILRGFVNLPSIQLAQKLTTILPKGLDHYLFTTAAPRRLTLPSE